MSDHDCISFNGGILMVGPHSEFSDEDVDKARRRIARMLRVRFDQVLDEEGIMLLRQEAAARCAISEEEA